jgi:hypothetical protein
MGETLGRAARIGKCLPKAREDLKWALVPVGGKSNSKAGWHPGARTRHSGTADGSEGRFGLRGCQKRKCTMSPNRSH